MILGITFGLLVFGGLAFLIAKAAIFALPLGIGIIVARMAAQSGAGVLGTVVVGLIGTISVFAAGQLSLLLVRSVLFRFVVASAFAVPSAVAGYHLALTLSRFSGAEGWWPPIFASVGSLIIAHAALQQLTTPSRARYPSNATPRSATAEQWSGSVTMAAGSNASMRARTSAGRTDRAAHGRRSPSQARPLL